MCAMRVRVAGVVVMLALALLAGGCGEKDEPTSFAAPTTAANAKASAPKLSLREAVALLAARVKVPVSLPTALPAAAKLSGRPAFAEDSAYLTVALPGKRYLT